MRPRRSAFILAALATVAVLVAAASASAATPRLSGETGPGFTIQLKSSTGKVKSLKAGTYVIKVEDKSPIHNFHLFGPGVNKTTSVDGTTETTWTVKLKPGTYTYQCDVHVAEGMKGTFKVVK
jgi:plastocyanin